MKGRGSNRLLASYAAWKNRTSRPLWSWREASLIDRFARALVRGEYRTTRPAAVACIGALESLRAQHPDEGWAVAPRSLMAVREQITQRAREFGGRWAESHWSQRERSIAERHARLFLTGRCPSVKQAARSCKEELDRLFGPSASNAGLVSHRPFYGVYYLVLRIVRQTGWTKPDGYWSAREKRITAKYARGIVDGLYPSANAAAIACRREFDRLRQRRPPPVWLAKRRRLLGINRMICDQARATGRFGRQPVWTTSELRMADRYARGVIAGRDSDAWSASLAFRREAGRAAKRRTRRAIHYKICERARLFGRPPRYRKWTADELRLLEKYVRGMNAGHFGSLNEAARTYLREVTRRRTARGWSAPPRSELAVIQSLRKQTITRGQRWRRYWNQAEEAARDKWVRWYGRRRRAGHSRALDQAVAGLMRDLERAGSRRTRAACVHQLTRRLRRGTA